MSKRAKSDAGAASAPDGLDLALTRLGRAIAEHGEPAAPEDRPADIRVKSSLRPAPKGDTQSDFFVPTLYDVATKDSRSIMDVAVFRLSKKDKRIGETIRYELTDGFVEVMGGPSRLHKTTGREIGGMASVWDFDIVLMAISHLTEAMNRYRAGQGEKPGRVFRPNASEILKFCRRSDGGRQHEDIEAALLRLTTTHIRVVRTPPVKVLAAKGSRPMISGAAEGLLNRYAVLSYADTGKIATLEIEVPNWIYSQVVEADKPEVLTVHPAFFLIEPGIGRFLYRLARRAAGNAGAALL
jgi:plasmid replication initiation protein